MNASGFLLKIVHFLAALAGIFVLIALGRGGARLLRQPVVIGEIVAGLLAGPILIASVGAHSFHALLPGQMINALKLVGEAGLSLFLVGLTHELRRSRGSGRHGPVGWVTVGALVAPLVAGALLAGWVGLASVPEVRGSAPTPAFVLMVSVSLSITAVPVLARILGDRGMSESAAGRIALASAVVIDTAGWLLLSAAVALRSGQADGFLRSTGLIGGGLLAAVALRHVLGTDPGRGLGMRAPVMAAGLVGVLAIAAALGVDRLGGTGIFGAVLVGLAIPAEESTPWTSVVALVGSAGRVLVPAFFVVTGITALTTGFTATPWPLIALAIVLGITGKVAGAYAGARLSGLPRQTALQIGVLMNTRGLTELIVLQVGYSAGILTTPMVLALMVMAMVATALTGPLLLVVGANSAPALAVTAVSAGSTTRRATGGPQCTVLRRNGS